MSQFSPFFIFFFSVCLYFSRRSQKTTSNCVFRCTNQSAWKWIRKGKIFVGGKANEFSKITQFNGNAGKILFLNDLLENQQKICNIQDYIFKNYFFPPHKKGENLVSKSKDEIQEKIHFGRGNFSLALLLISGNWWYRSSDGCWRSFVAF